MAQNFDILVEDSDTSINVRMEYFCIYLYLTFIYRR